MTPEDAIQRAQAGKLAGLNLAGIVRMSFEMPIEEAEEEFERLEQLKNQTGKDFKGRDVQDGDCRTYVERRDGTYVYTYDEPDTSAWKRKRVTLPDGTTVWRVIRPVFDNALADLKRGKAPNGRRLDGLVVYDLDRLTRDNRHLEDAIDVVTHHHRPILDTTGSIDLLTENGRTMARVLVTMSGKQSADTARRVKRKHRVLQQAGIPAGGPRPFGWNDDRRTLRTHESDELATAAERILNGAPVSALAIEWNKRGILTASGKTWTASTITLVLRSPRICGLRSRTVDKYNPETDTENRFLEIVRDIEGKPVVGQWQPIITVKEWEDLTAIIGLKNAPARGKNSRTYLLSGYLRCGRCGFKLRARKSPKPAIQFTYGCPSRSGGGCGGISITGPPVDALITEAVISKYELEAKIRKEHSDDDDDDEPEWDGAERLGKLEDDLKKMNISWRTPGGMDSDTYFALLPDVQAEVRILRAEEKNWRARIIAKSVRPADIRSEWVDYTTAQRRAHIDDVLIAVEVKPANHFKGKYKERLNPIWRKPNSPVESTE